MGIADYNAVDILNKTVPGSPAIEIGKGIHSPQGHDIQRQAIQRIMADLKNTPVLSVEGGTAGLAILADSTVADVRTYISAAPYVANLAALKALDTTKDTVARYDGDHWDWLTGDYSTQVTADTVGAIFAKADAIATTSGAWVRRGGYYAMGRAKFDWFGVPADNTAATSAFETMLTICAALGLTRLEAAEKGIYALEDADIPAGSFDIEWNWSKLQGTYTVGDSTQNIITATNGSSTTTLRFNNYVVDGGWDSSDTTAAASQKVIAIKGYKHVDLGVFDLRDCAKGGSSATEIFTRADMAIDVWNCKMTVGRPRLITNNRRYECIVIKSDDATHAAHMDGGIFYDQQTSGSPFSFFNLAPGSSWENFIVDNYPSGANILMKGYVIRNFYINDIAGNGLDCFESIKYGDGGLVENGLISACIDGGGTARALLVGGTGVTVRNVQHTGCDLGLCAETALAANALNGTYGSWVDQTEKPIDVLFDRCFGGGHTATTTADIRVFGSSSNLASFEIIGADKEASATQSDRAVWSRHIKRGVLRGTFRNGSEATFRHDLGEGTYILDADVHVQSAAHVFHNERASASACTVTLYWKSSMRRHGSLGASNYDISKGSTPESYTGIYIEGPNWPTMDTTDITSTTPQYRNNKLFGTATYDPASLADGAGVTTAVTVTGASLGDLAYATFSNALADVTLTAWVSSSNNVQVRFQNESGGVVDLASGTIRAWVEKAHA